MLSFITLHPESWNQHSYVSLCGTSQNAMMWMLEQNPNLRQVALCLDNDEAGIKASQRLSDALRERGYSQIEVLLPSHKDWNEDLTTPSVSEVQGMTMTM